MLCDIDGFQDHWIKLLSHSSRGKHEIVHVPAVSKHEVDHVRIELAPAFDIGTDNPAVGLVRGPALRCARLISALMAFGAKQLDIVRLLAS